MAWFLMCANNADKVPALIACPGAVKTSAISVLGDLQSPKLEIAKENIQLLGKNEDHFFHPAAACFYPLFCRVCFSFAVWSYADFRVVHAALTKPQTSVCFIIKQLYTSAVFFSVDR